MIFSSTCRGSCFLAAFSLAGCAVAPREDELTARLYAGPAATFAIGVVEARPAVLSGERSPRMEGLVHGTTPIGPTFSATKRHNRAGESFVDYLAGFIAQGMGADGSRAAVIRVPAGPATEGAWKKLQEAGADRYVMLRVNESTWNYHVGSSSTSYRFDFEILVGRRDGTVLGAKTFSGDRSYRVVGIDHYNVYDMHSILYRRVLEEMFSDPSIVRALGPALN